MRGIKIDSTDIYYASLGTTSTTDEWGNSALAYSNPVLISVNLSANKGSVNAEGFGADLKYDREMTVYDTDCPIDEYSRLWIDVATTESHNYEVTKKAPSKNLIRYAIKKVNVDDTVIVEEEEDEEPAE